MLMAGLEPRPPGYESTVLTYRATEVSNVIKTFFMIKVLGTYYLLPFIIFSICLDCIQSMLLSPEDPFSTSTKNHVCV